MLLFFLFQEPKLLISMLKKVDDAKILKSPYELSLNFSYGKHDKGNTKLSSTRNEIQII